MFIRLDASIVNEGGGESATTTLRYYRSTDNSISDNDTEAATDGVGRLDPDEVGSESYSFSPNGLDTDTYYYYACVDGVTGESDSTNNCSSVIEVDHGGA